MLDSLILIKPLGRSGYFEEHYVYRFYTMVVGNRNIGQCIDKKSLISFGQYICGDRSLLSISSLVNATFNGTGKTLCIQKHVPYCAVTVKVGHVIDFDAPLYFYFRNSRGSVSWHQNQRAWFTVSSNLSTLYVKVNSATFCSKNKRWDRHGKQGNITCNIRQGGYNTS